MTDFLAQLEDALFYPSEELSSMSNDLDQTYLASQEPSITKKIKKEDHVVVEAPHILPILEEKQEKKEIEIIALSDNSGEQRDDETSQQKLCSDMQMEKQEEIVILQQGDIPNASESAKPPSLGCQLTSGSIKFEELSKQNGNIHQENGEQIKELGEQINSKEEQICEKKIENNEKQEAAVQSDNINGTQTQLETIKPQESDKQEFLKLFWIDYQYREKQYLEWLREMAVEQEKQEAELRKAYLSSEPADEEQADKWRKIGNKLKPNLSDIPKVKGKRGRKRKVDIQAAQELAKATLEAEQQLAAEQHLMGLSQIENLQDNQLKEIKPFSHDVEKVSSEILLQRTGQQGEITDVTNKPYIQLPLSLVAPSVQISPNNYPSIGDKQLFRIVKFVNSSERQGISLDKKQEYAQREVQPSSIHENSPEEQEEEGFIQIHEAKLEKPPVNIVQPKPSKEQRIAAQQIQFKLMPQQLAEQSKNAAKKVPPMFIDLESNESNSPQAAAQPQKIFAEKKKPIPKNKVPLPPPPYVQSSNSLNSKKIYPVNEKQLPPKANTIKQFETITVDSDEDDLNDPKKDALPEKNNSTQIAETKNIIAHNSGNIVVSQERYQQFLTRPPFVGQGISPSPSREEFYKNQSHFQTGGSNQNQMLPPAYPNEHFRQYHSQQSGFGQSVPSAPFLIPSSASRQSDQDYFTMMNNMNSQPSQLNQDLLSHVEKSAGFHYPNISPFNNGFPSSLPHPMSFNYHQLQNDPQLQHFSQYPVLYQTQQQQQYMQNYKQQLLQTQLSIHEATKLADGQLRRSGGI